MSPEEKKSNNDAKLKRACRMPGLGVARAMKIGASGCGKGERVP